VIAKIVVFVIKVFEVNKVFYLTQALFSFRPTPAIGSYLIPENFQQRNMDLIQSIKNFLQNDETKFNEFKNYSGQFRQVTFKPRFQLLLFFFPSVKWI